MNAAPLRSVHRWPSAPRAARPSRLRRSFGFPLTCALVAVVGACATTPPVAEAPAPCESPARAAPMDTPAVAAGGGAAVDLFQALPPDAECSASTPLVAGRPGSPGHLIPTELRPDGASELAVLMRLMQRDLDAARAAILRGEKPGPMHDRHRRMRCAWPTSESDRTPTFDALAVAYLAQVKALESNPEDPRLAYEGARSMCRACHEHTCPGPLEAIEALRMSEAR